MHGTGGGKEEKKPGRQLGARFHVAKNLYGVMVWKCSLSQWCVYWGLVPSAGWGLERWTDHEATDLIIYKPSVGAQFWEVGQWGKVSWKGVLGPCLFWLLLLVCREVSNTCPLHNVLLPSGQENVDGCLWNHEPIFLLIFRPSTGVFRNIAPFSTSASLSVKFQRDNSTWKVLAI